MSAVTVGVENADIRNVKGWNLGAVVASLFGARPGSGLIQTLKAARRAAPVAVVHSNLSARPNSALAYECESWLDWNRK